MQTISKVKTYIQENNLLNPHDNIIVGVSGGADSMVLLTILHNLNYKCIAAHCNFHLRKEESDRDCLFVKSFCFKNNIPFISVDFDTYAYMAEKSVSLEMAARELRYNWFEQIKKEYNADKIAVAHHLDDSVETALINFIRGTGIKGLTGIKPVNGHVIRPLLCLYREEVIEFVNINDIDFVTDSTNNEDIYIRNKIRLDLIPLLKTINPSAVRSIIKTISNLSSTEKIYNETIQNIRKKLLLDNSIDIISLKQQTEPITILFEILHPYGFNIDTVTDIFRSLDGISGKIFYSKEYRIVKDRDLLIIEKKKIEKASKEYRINKNSTFIETPIHLEIETFSIDSSVQIEKNPSVIYLDKNKINFPLTIRRWKEGDRFVPFGMKGSKKISDFFTDQKYTLIGKENTWLLCSGDKIVWIIGKRADDRFKLTNQTTNVLKITLLG